MLEDNFLKDNDNGEEQRYYLLYALLVSLFVGLISQLLSYYFDYNYAYRDSIFRMEAARRFFDSDNPGIINQLGTVWLPVPNLILMPFAYVDYLWRTGIAASIINFPLFVISSIIVFLSVKKITENVIGRLVNIGDGKLSRVVDFTEHEPTQTGLLQFLNEKVFHIGFAQFLHQTYVREIFAMLLDAEPKLSRLLKCGLDFGQSFYDQLERCDRSGQVSILAFEAL